MNTRAFHFRIADEIVEAQHPRSLDEPVHSERPSVSSELRDPTWQSTIASSTRVRRSTSLGGVKRKRWKARAGSIFTVAGLLRSEFIGGLQDGTSCPSASTKVTSSSNWPPCLQRVNSPSAASANRSAVVTSKFESQRATRSPSKNSPA